MDTQKLIDKLSESLDLPEDKTGFLIKCFADLMILHGENLDNVSVPGFGSFEFRLRNEREVVHPASGKRLLIPPKVTINFRPTPLLKTKIKDGR